MHAPHPLPNSRRRFLLAAGAVPAAGVLTPTVPPARRPLQADVLVVGGGVAGSIAAIQAGRLGARTVLVEAGSQLGGTMTTAGVDFPGLFHAWGRQIIAGIGWELVCATVKLNGGRLPDFSVPYGSRHWQHQVRLNGGLYAAIAEEACVNAAVDLRYYETPLSIQQDEGGWRVRLAGKGAELEVAAKQLVDCTGNAAAIALAGLPRQRGSATQPGTLIYRLAGYDLKRADLAAMAAGARQAVNAGRLQPADFRHDLRGFLASGGENAMHVPNADSSTSELHTRTNIRGRQSLLRMMRFLKPFPGFENLRLERVQPETGVRETFRIAGESEVTVDDYTGGRRFADAVAYSFYPVDLHDERGIRPRQLEPGTVPTIPLGALIPRSSRNVMAAGRSISSDRLANSGLRVQASCMAMGQAAGVAAALAARSGLTPAKVPLAEILETLRRHGAITPE
ncbi:MAG: FAD-dependent oxidoreductase [Bryobacterales bacterium]|nr:FAD-dependent oxidoreductase [Bryobacterales bacterium]